MWVTCASGPPPIPVEPLELNWSAELRKEVTIARGEVKIVLARPTSEVIFRDHVSTTGALRTFSNVRKVSALVLVALLAA
eukprot:SAG25_NODE_474_length_7638_cov_5.842962_7_plen_80_part_00